MARFGRAQQQANLLAWEREAREKEAQAVAAREAREVLEAEVHKLTQAAQEAEAQNNPNQDVDRTHLTAQALRRTAKQAEVYWLPEARQAEAARVEEARQAKEAWEEMARRALYH